MYRHHTYCVLLVCYIPDQLLLWVGGNVFFICLCFLVQISLIFILFLKHGLYMFLTSCIHPSVADVMFSLCNLF